MTLQEFQRRYTALQQLGDDDDLYSRLASGDIATDDALAQLDERRRERDGMRDDYTDAELRMFDHEELTGVLLRADEICRDLNEEIMAAMEAVEREEMSDDYYQEDDAVEIAEKNMEYACERVCDPLDRINDLRARIDQEFERRAGLSNHERLFEYKMRRVAA